MPSLQAITMPKWGMTMTEGRLVSWLIEEGAHVRIGQEIMEVETEKITNVVESLTDGVLRRIVVPEGTNMPVGALLAVFAEPDVSESDVEAFIASYAERSKAPADSDGGASASHIIEIGEHQLNVRTLLGGEGLPVVLIHGFGGDSGTWLFNQDELARGRTVHAIDLPAHGGSAPSAPSGRVEDIALAVSAALPALGFDKGHLVGHSLGGGVAIAVAGAMRDRIASLTLIAPIGLGPEISSEYIELFLAADRRKPMKEALSKLFANPKAVSAEMVENVLRFKRQDGVPESLAAIAGNLIAEGRQTVDLRKALADIEASILLIWGEEDKVIPPAQIDALPKQIQVERIARVGHMPMMEAAGTVNRLILTHLTRAEAENGRQ